MKPEFKPQNAKYNQGFTLVETMISMVIGLILIGGILDILLSNVQTNRLQIALSHVQQHGSSSLNLLADEIRMADYRGCYSDLSSGIENTLNNQTHFAWDLSNSIEGRDNVTPSDSIGGISNFIAGSDVIAIKGMSEGSPVLSTPDANTLSIASTYNQFSTGQIVLVTDCEKAAMFQVSNTSTSSNITTISHTNASMIPGNWTGSVSNVFDSSAEIAALNSILFYLKNNPDGRPALYQARLTVNAGSALFEETELVANIEDMQIIYGIDNNGDFNVDTYQDASAISDWKNIISVRIALLQASSTDHITADKELYRFDPNNFEFTKTVSTATGANQRLRRTFSSAITLRNRSL